jgi:protein-disulfide isomerase/uncharacterized membrane protein
VHYRLLTQPGYTSFCDISDAVSCTSAYLSQYGSFQGIPVALLGMLFFAVILLIVGVGGRVNSPMRDNVPGYVFALSTVGLAFVMYLAWASITQLKSLCPLCAITYAAVIALFLISGQVSSVPMSTLPRRATRDAVTFLKSPLALIAIVVLVAGSVWALNAFPKEPGEVPVEEEVQYAPLTDGQRAQFEQWYNVQPVVEVPVDKGDAKVLIVKFNDYQCPPCRQTHREYKGILAKYIASGDVKYVLKHFPLEIECNTLPGSHTAACEAAAAVLMAQKLGTNVKMEEWLFANQGPPQLTAQQVKDAARDVAGIKDFDAQYASIIEQVKVDAGLGRLLGAKSTPTFFINGRMIAGGLPPAAFEAAIELELKRGR